MRNMNNKANFAVKQEGYDNIQHNSYDHSRYFMLGNYLLANTAKSIDKNTIDSFIFCLYSNVVMFY